MSDDQADHLDLTPEEEIRLLDQLIAFLVARKAKTLNEAFALDETEDQS